MNLARKALTGPNPTEFFIVRVFNCLTENAAPACIGFCASAIYLLYNGMHIAAIKEELKEIPQGLAQAFEAVQTVLF